MKSSSISSNDLLNKLQERVSLLDTRLDLRKECGYPEDSDSVCRIRSQLSELHYCIKLIHDLEEESSE